MQGSAAPGQWVHYKLEVPMGTGSTALQVRVELLQPGRGSYGARLRVSNGPLDCYKTDGFDYEAERSELCRPGACQVRNAAGAPVLSRPAPTKGLQV